MNENISGKDGLGYVIVQATTASSAIPLEGARVRIYRAEQGDYEVLYNLVTGPDGRTERVPLTAPARSMSLSPSDGKPYASYSIEVSRDGYEGALFSAVPIFDGITAIQQANLVPLPENGYTDDFTLDGPRPFDTEIDFGL